jgi:cytoskeletal protein RodZ
MKDNYLWDRSGEPDDEVQELEELLGTLRYQPRPLEIRANFVIKRRHSFSLPLAIAATLILFAVAIGLWINFNRRQQNSMSASARDSEIKTAIAPQPKPVSSDQVLANRNPDTSAKTPSAPHSRPHPRPLLAANKTINTRVRQAALTPDELAQKEQVLVALRLVSAKLNLAQRKTQALPQANIIRNQHKIG